MPISPHTSASKARISKGRKGASTPPYNTTGGTTALAPIRSVPKVPFCPSAAPKPHAQAIARDFLAPTYETKAVEALVGGYTY